MGLVIGGQQIIRALRYLVGGLVLLSSTMIETSAPPAFALFDYIITLPRECSSVWQRRPSALSALLFFLRYGSLSYGTISVASIFVQSPEVVILPICCSNARLIRLIRLAWGWFGLLRACSFCLCSYSAVRLSGCRRHNG